MRRVLFLITLLSVIMRLVKLSEKRDIVIEYTTEPTVMGINLYKHFVLEYASALFDGRVDNKYIDQILSKIP